LLNNEQKQWLRLKFIVKLRERYQLEGFTTNEQQIQLIVDNVYTNYNREKMQRHFNADTMIEAYVGIPGVLWFVTLCDYVIELCNEGNISLPPIIIILDKD